MKKDEMTYAQALARLDEIVKRLETGDVNVDELSASVKEGVRLVTWCRKKLRTTQEEVEAALKGLDAEETGHGEPMPPARTSRAAAPEEDDAMVDPFA